jgi:hypothetical protein
MLLSSSPYTAPLARLGKIRSTGITDLRFGNLLDEDWKKRDRFERGADLRVPVPLPEGVACYAIDASAGQNVVKPEVILVADDFGGKLLGDGIVPVASALGRHSNPRLALTFEESRQWVAYGTNHLDLLSAPGVYAQIRQWLAAPVEREDGAPLRSELQRQWRLRPG